MKEGILIVLKVHYINHRGGKKATLHGKALMNCRIQKNFARPGVLKSGLKKR